MSKNPLDKYLQGLKDWQEHQFNPGHWTGGRIPFWFRRGNKKLRWALILEVALVLIFLIFVLYVAIIQREPILSPSFIILLVLLILTLWAAIKT